MKQAIFLIALAVGLVQSAAQTAAPPTLPVSVLSKGPSDSDTDLLVFCLFRSSPRNKLSASLVETDDKLHGLLTEVRRPGLFNGELGETMMLTPAPGTMKPRKVLIIGLGDSQTFTPARMYLIGKIAFLEADRLGVAHPFFAASILDGGVTKFTTGEVATFVVGGFRDALALEQTLHARGGAGPPVVADFTYLAGPKNVSSTTAGIAKAMTKASAQ
jgi:hypothetical protein